MNTFFHRYQRKIGTYDKQQWERTVEQHILDGLTHVPMRAAKLKTELIDVDLVRGEPCKRNLRYVLLRRFSSSAYTHLVYVDVCRILVSKGQTEAWFVDGGLPGLSTTPASSLVQRLVDSANERSHLYAFPFTLQLTGRQHLSVLCQREQRERCRGTRFDLLWLHALSRSILDYRYCLLADCIHVGSIGTHRHDVYSLYRSFAHCVDAFGSCHDVQSIQTTNNQAFSTRQMQKRKIKAQARST